MTAPAGTVRRLARRAKPFLAPLLAIIALMAWALASPVAASPDDDFHLVSIWCADEPNEFCAPGSDEGLRVVPEALVSASCYAFDSDESAACQREVSFAATPTVETARGNYAGGYPDVYYTVMNALAGPNIQASVVAMRALNVLLFVGLGSALWMLLPTSRRRTLMWSWAVTTVPLGLFVLTSNNPSAWAVMGIGSAWLALVGWFETTGGRKAALGAVFAISAIMAAGARGDAAVYMLAAIAAAIVLTVRRDREYLLDAILPAAVAAACVGLFRFSRPVQDVTGGIVSEERPSILGQTAGNLLETPFLWMGAFGKEWGLGWLDTSMPAVVWIGALGCFLGAGFLAAGYLSRRKALMLIPGAIILWLLPTAVLVAAGDAVGENMQPRYLLPLIVLFAGVLFFAPGDRSIRFTRLQTLVVIVTLSISQAVALHLSLQRYVFGFDDLGWNLDAGVEWWWAIPLSPMTVWLAGSAAYAGLLFLLLHERVPKRASAPAGEPARQTA